MIVSSTDSRSASNHAVTSLLVSDSDGKKLSDSNLLLGNFSLPHLAGIILVQFFGNSGIVDLKCALFS